MGLGLGKCDNINRMITLSVITLSSFHCTIKNCYCLKSNPGTFDTILADANLAIDTRCNW